MGNLEEALSWLEQAEADFKSAKDLLKARDFYAAAFFSQQVAEKCLKGLLYSKGFRALLTHSVTELLEKAAESKSQFKKFINIGKELDRHYIGSRYPNFYPKGAAVKYYTKELAQECINYAGLILEEVKKLLKS
ncbi:MAG: HEPN domain-containing protein [Candidatus Omnitrophica bacterium]|nr:HEPN domain-containing protein [Candidatus Omnitrophota bacterium]